ncbi:DUF2254 domain-containing protein [Dermatophilaceae bacterium Sec6.4]
MSRVGGWAAQVRDSLRTQLWPIPAIVVLIAVLAGLFIPRLDENIDGNVSGWLDGILFGGDAGAARQLLDTVASSLITVTSLTFSLTVVTLQLASSQFSPRLLRTFTRDLFVQITLALFLGTFAYSLTVLRAVRSEGSTSSAFVPQLAVTLSFVLGVVSVLGLVLFLAHLVRQIRAEVLLCKVATDCLEVVEDVTEPASQDDVISGGSVSAYGPTSRYVCSHTSGFLIRVDEQELLAMAVKHHLTLVIDRMPGDFVVAEVPLGYYQPDDPDAEPVDLSEHLGACLHTGMERTDTQDIGYGLRQLSDVANKALSPGINDPTTAVHAISHISVILCMLARRNLGDARLYDDGGALRVVLRRPDLGRIVDDALRQPRLYGVSDPVVLRALYRALTDLAWRVHPHQAWLVRDELRRLDQAAAARDATSGEAREASQWSKEVAEALDAAAAVRD